jgi:rod shape-determining protein MreD
MTILLRGSLTVLGVFLVFTVLHGLAVPLVVLVNVFTIAVILFGVIEGEIPGAVFGMVCGLIVDSFSLGVFGLAGVANTVAGYLAGVISRKIDVVRPARLCLFVGLMAALDLGLWAGLSAVFFSEGFPWTGGWLLAQPFVSALLGTAAFLVYRRLKARHDR